MAEFLVLHQKNNDKVRVVNIEHVRMLRPHDEPTPRRHARAV